MNGIKFKAWWKSRLPASSEMFSVYSVIVFWVFGWGVLIFLFNFPSWLLMVSLWEILGYFSYGMLSFFLDSIFLLGLILVAAMLLPPVWLRNDFSAGGSALAGLLFAWITVFQVAFLFLMDMPASQMAAFLLVIAVSLFLSVLVARRLSPIRKLVLWFASSTGLFVYLYGFLTAVSLLVVLIRNFA